MRLINTTTFSLETFFNCEDHEYAILSHTWGDEEVVLEDMADLAKARTKRGFIKIKEMCRLSREHGIKYAWVDTCCIDKRSSAELTEAINSMFQWYKMSKVCFAFLSDFGSDSEAELAGCKWFTRGWTLQELIASPNIDFYDENWTFIGDKVSMEWPLSSITNVDIEILRDSDLLSTIAVAKRMSWAAARQTTRLEDRAYSLFGLFDVNLPLIYGEGQKAFLRLQEAIAVNNDLSLFAWTAEEDDDQELRGLFAKSPSEYKYCENLVRVLNPMIPQEGFTMVNQDFHLKTHIYRAEQSDKGYVLDLQCMTVMTPRHTQQRYIAIYILKTAHGYIRHEPKQNTARSSVGNTITNSETVVHIPKFINPAQSRILVEQLAHNFRFQFKDIENPRSYGSSYEVHPQHLYDSSKMVFITNGYAKFTGAIIIDVGGASTLESRQAVVFGLISVSTPEIKNNNKRTLKPWATILNQEIRHLVFKNERAHQPIMIDSLVQVGLSMREIAAAEGLWTTLFVKGPWKNNQGSYVKIEVSVEMDEAKRASGMYGLFVQITRAFDK